MPITWDVLYKTQDMESTLEKSRCILFLIQRNDVDFRRMIN